MCGIAGFIGGKENCFLEAVLKSMTSRIAHRRSDDERKNWCQFCQVVIKIKCCMTFYL